VGGRKLADQCFKGGGMYASGIPQKLAWEPTIYIWVKYTCTWILAAINVKKEHRYSINMQKK
jgi:hypothetical protein